MATTHLAGNESETVETEAERAARLAHERALLDEGWEDIRRKRCLTGAELDAWLYSFEQCLPLPGAPEHDAG